MPFNAEHTLNMCCSSYMSGISRLLCRTFRRNSLRIGKKNYKTTTPNGPGREWSGLVFGLARSRRDVRIRSGSRVLYSTLSTSSCPSPPAESQKNVESISKVHCDKRRLFYGFSSCRERSLILSSPTSTNVMCVAALPTALALNPHQLMFKTCLLR